MRADREVRKADETGREEGKKTKIKGSRVWVLIFCQQEVRVTMVTRQRSDVIASKRSLALWGYFWGVGSASLFFTLSSLLLHIRIKMATIL